MGVQVQEVPSQTETPTKSGTPKLGYVRELKEEMKRVTWTSKEELTLFTKIVVGATFFFGLGIYGVDLLIKGVLTGIGSLIHLIFG